MWVQQQKHPPSELAFLECGVLPEIGKTEEVWAADSGSSARQIPGTPKSAAAHTSRKIATSFRQFHRITRQLYTTPIRMSKCAPALFSVDSVDCRSVLPCDFARRVAPKRREEAPAGIAAAESHEEPECRPPG